MNPIQMRRAAETAPGGASAKSTISADVSGLALRLTSVPKTNHGVFRSINGATLLINTAVNQSPAAELLTDGGVLTIENTTITGGRIIARGGSVIGIGGDATFDDVVKIGDLSIPNANILRILPGGGVFSNTGTIVVNQTAGPNSTLVQFRASTSVEGEGQIVLNAHPANIGTSYLAGNSGSETLTLGPAQTFAGSGRFFLAITVNGTLAPGALGGGIGWIDGSQRLTLGSGSVTNIELGGTGTALFDRVTTTQPLEVDGELIVTFRPGYSPARNDTFTILQGSTRSGEFPVLTFPPLANGIGLRARYTSAAVIIDAICYADINEDGGIDGSDVSAFFESWEAGLPIADLNGDGGVDGADVAFFFEVWEAGGC